MAATVDSTAPALAALLLAQEIIGDVLALAQNGAAVEAADRLPAVRLVLSAAAHLPEYPPAGTDVGPFFVWHDLTGEWTVNPDVEAAVAMAEDGATGAAHELFKLI